MRLMCRLFGHEFEPVVIWETMPSGRETFGVSFHCKRGCFTP